MIHYERNAYYLHEKSFIKGYKFMKIERKDDVTVYKIYNIIHIKGTHGNRI